MKNFSKDVPLDSQIAALRKLQNDISWYIDKENDEKVDQLSSQFEDGIEAFFAFTPKTLNEFKSKCAFLEHMLVQSHEYAELVKKVFQVIYADVEGLKDFN